ncbi:PACE efflux transporter [Leisingera thetidis]|uniref:PACE efflux transporter n=1 Tax=Leisingera thetidis TaxID=2930199 RepID=UPI0021F769BE|nr:PACE efflux transporter [Leisingera thetidis]
MRTAKDRIRHAISFEVIGLLLATPIGAWLFDIPMQHFGVAALVCATLATVWNYVYNMAFDRTLQHLAGSTRKTISLRVLHAVVFELGLLLALMPFLAWYLDISLYEAFVVDVGFAGFYLVYAFVFNWGYDIAFPVPHSSSASAAEAG